MHCYTGYIIERLQAIDDTDLKGKNVTDLGEFDFPFLKLPSETSVFGVFYLFGENETRRIQNRTITR